MAWAGKNALADHYGDGHYGTQAAHSERWDQFCNYARGEEVRDVRQVSEELVKEYGQTLQQQVATNEMAVSYAQNLLSSVNVVLEAMRGDSQIRVSPSELVGERCNVRQEIPVGLERERLQQATSDLRDRGEERVAVIAELARELGLRFREASLLDAQRALQQAEHKGLVNITEGTKGGRGHLVDRWVQVLPVATPVLERAAELQGEGRNLIPDGSSYAQWRDHAYHAWSKVSHDAELQGFHDLRAAYACERYQQLTGYPAPVVAGERLANKDADMSAREIISAELGHGRVDVVSAYVGSAH
ncbi:MAG: integrase domain-containing protein [gamma proteobacterium endosymbiont of Lamellibrachia anaximandri]|nr:integrase domain-containing protein [gamma proteobacterium endosymbiont of Lamellibrachia anaximandri]MBL3618751.1 integrase domain-containing protein [gamma proteobacterium endosymbiont of Lamellibrachia anaximandri]